MRREILSCLATLALVGCAITRGPLVELPADGFVNHRAVLNAPGRQFTFNGYLSLNAAGAKRLVIAENFGGVLADVLVKPDGRIFVMKSSAAFPAARIRNHIAADLESVFGTKGGRMTSPEKNRVVLKRLGYSLDIRILEVRSGAQQAKLFDETTAEKP